MKKRILYNKRGVIDQAITSVIVLFAVFFLMAVFVIVSGNIERITGTSGTAKALAEEEADSRVLADIFLSDEIEINGKKSLVAEAFTEAVSSYRARELNNAPQDYATGIFRQALLYFDQKYSCGQQNELLLIADAVKGTVIDPSTKKSYIEYPSAKWPDGKAPRYLESWTEKERDKFLYELHKAASTTSLRGGVNGYYVYNLKDSAYLFIKENKKC